MTPTETPTCKRCACWQSVRTESREWMFGRKKGGGEKREIGICQVEARRKTAAWDEEQGCLAADRETSVLGDKDRGAL